MATPTATTAGTQVPGGHPPKGVFPPFDPANFAPVLIWLALTFGALYLLMSRVALPRVESILKTRADRIAGDLDAAGAAKTRAEEAGKAFDRTLADAKGKAQALAQATHDRLSADSDARRHALEADLNAKLAAAEAEIATIKERSMGNVDAIARDAAAAIVERIAGRPADAAAIAQAVSAARA